MQINNLKSQVKTIDRGSYRWRQFFNCWTGRPEYALYFPATRLEGGDELPAMYVTSVAHNRDDGSVEWHRIRFYGQLADFSNNALKERNKVALLSVEGVVAKRTFKDRNGNDREEYYVIVSKPENIKVLAIKDHIGTQSSTNPFSMAGSDVEPEENPVNPSTTADVPF